MKQQVTKRHARRKAHKAAFKPVNKMIRVGTVMGIPQALESLGLDSGEVLAEGGFDPGIFSDPDNLLAFTTRSQLIDHCTKKSACEYFGLLIGQRAGLHSLGLVGLLMRYSPDVRTALNNLVRYFHLHAHHSTSTSLQVQGGTAMLGFQIHQNIGSAGAQTADGALAIMVNMLRELCRPGWKPKEIWFMHSKPENLRPFQEFFEVRLRFNAEQNAVVLDSSCLTWRLPEVHDEVRQLVQKHVDQLASLYTDDFPEQVRTVLRASFISGDITAEHVAAMFSIHTRTLNRHLGAYGISYRDLVEEIRFEMARQILESSNTDIREVATILLYADQRSFIRAFRRWSGTTPARWRAAQKRQRLQRATW